MPKTDIITRLRDEADNNAGLRSELAIQKLLNEAADEIEYLREQLAAAHAHYQSNNGGDE